MPKFKLTIGFWNSGQKWCDGDLFYDSQTYYFDTAAEAFEFLQRRNFTPEEIRLYDPNGDLIHTKG